MKLQTKIDLQPQEGNLLDYDSHILAIGSCFVENIGNKLEYFKFKNLINPTGILFNPIAIEKLINRSVDSIEFNKEDLTFNSGVWSCKEAHSKMNALSEETILSNLNAQLLKTREGLYNSSHLIITLGTAWIYREVYSNEIVANCHKRPQSEFKKELLSIEAIHSSLNNILDLVKNLNEHITLIFTVSPVRHIKDGFIQNTLSKAHLISAVHQIVQKHNYCHYFPAYEIMMDELRDYRFYEPDMLHPTAQSIDYIWDLFKSSWIDPKSITTMHEVEKVQRAMAHKAFNADSVDHQNFLKEINRLKNRLTESFPHFRF